MKLKFVRFPKWKVYLYTLIQRIRRYKKVNRGKLFLFNPAERNRLRGMLNEYCGKGITRQNKAVQYDQLVRAVFKNVTVASKSEFNIASKLCFIIKINIKDLVMEIKKIKKLAESEIGLTTKEMKGLTEEQLVIAMIKGIDPKKRYSDEFIKWYDDVSDELIEKAEQLDDENSNENNEKEIKMTKENEVDVTELIEAINECTKVSELKEYIEDEDYADFFTDVDVTKLKTTKKLKAAMLEAFETPDAAADKIGDESESVSVSVDDLREAVNGCSKTKELKELIAEYPIPFEDVDQSTKLAPKLKKTMLKALDSIEDAGEEKEAAGDDEEEFSFDPENFDPDEVYAEIEAMNLDDIKTVASDVLEIEKPKKLKKTLLKQIAETLQALAEENNGGGSDDEESETEITAELINDAVEAEDTETLLEVCEALDVKVNALLKKSAKRMGKKCLEAIDAKVADAPDEKEDETEPAEEKTSVYQMIEKLVEKGKDEKAIVKAVTPYFEERGKKKLYITKTVKALIGVAEMELNK